MSTKFILLASVIGLATIPLLQAQSPTPAESPAAEKKHRTHKKAEAAASPAENATSPAAAESPAASPKAKRGGKTKTTAAAVPAVSPASSPAKKTLADYFKPKTSASPAGAAAAGTGAAAAGALATPASGYRPGLVWVNTETHIYHKEGSRFYGNTTHGKYVSEADAIKEGDRPAKRE